MDPIPEVNYKLYVRVITIKDLLALSPLRHEDSFCFYYCSTSGENVETSDHSMHSLCSYNFESAAYFTFLPLLMYCLFQGVTEWVYSSYGLDQQPNDLALNLSSAIYIFVRLTAFFLHCINYCFRSI